MLGVLFVTWAMLSAAATIFHLVGGITFVAVVSGLFGARSIGGRRAKPVTSAASLKQLVVDRAIPFSVCTDCRIVIELPHAFSCPECSTTDRCVVVHRESERSMAIAAIGTDDS